MYTLIISDDSHEYETRSEALRAAREASDGRRGPVHVEDDEQKEAFVYVQGELARYQFETRDRRRRRG